MVTFMTKQNDPNLHESDLSFTKFIEKLRKTIKNTKHKLEQISLKDDDGLANFADIFLNKIPELLDEDILIIPIDFADGNFINLIANKKKTGKISLHYLDPKNDEFCGERYNKVKGFLDNLGLSDQVEITNISSADNLITNDSFLNYVVGIADEIYTKLMSKITNSPNISHLNEAPYPLEFTLNDNSTLGLTQTLKNIKEQLVHTDDVVNFLTNYRSDKGDNRSLFTTVARDAKGDLTLDIATEDSLFQDVNYQKMIDIIGNAAASVNINLDFGYNIKPQGIARNLTPDNLARRIISQKYDYADNDIEALVKISLGEKRKADFHMATISLTDGTVVAEQLNEAVQQLDLGKKGALLSINTGTSDASLGAHWIGGMLTKNDGKLTFTYNDSVGKISTDFIKIHLQSNGLKDVEIKNLNVLQQYEDTGPACGAWTVDNLVKIATGEPLVDVAKSIKGLHPNEQEALKQALSDSLRTEHARYALTDQVKSLGIGDVLNPPPPNQYTIIAHGKPPQSHILKK